MTKDGERRSEAGFATKRAAEYALAAAITDVERTRAGLEAAKAKWRTGDRLRALDAKKLARLHKLAASGDYTRAEIAEMVKVSPATLYRVLAES